MGANRQQEPEWLPAASVHVCMGCSHVYAVQGLRRRRGTTYKRERGTTTDCPECGSTWPLTKEVDSVLLSTAGEPPLADVLNLTRERIARYGFDGPPSAKPWRWSARRERSQYPPDSSWGHLFAEMVDSLDDMCKELPSADDARYWGEHQRELAEGVLSRLTLFRERLDELERWREFVIESD